MAQNTSHAVMAQRVEPHDSLDDFPTQPWGTRALVEHVLPDIRGALVWEPACNRGYMARPLSEYAVNVWCSDVFDYGFGDVEDFLFPGTRRDCEWVVTNPPFRLAKEFIEKGLEVASEGVAVLCRTSFVEGVGRYNALFKPRPPAIVAHFVERLPLVKGRVDPNASTATSYSWFVWSTLHDVQTRTVWIPPCRKALERAGDYDAAWAVARDTERDADD